MLKPTQVHESKPLTSNSIATISIPTSGKIHSLILRFSTSAGADVTEAAIRSEIGNIRLTINGKDVVNASAIKLLDLYEALGQNVNDNLGIASVVELNIGRLVYTDPNLREIFGFGTADVQSIQVSVTAATLTTIANVQAFTSRTPVNENLGTYCKFINYVIGFNTTGDHTVDTLPRDADSTYLAVMADPGASGTITHGEVRVNSYTIKERCPTSVNKLLVSNDRMATPVALGYYVYSFCDGALDTRLPMVDVRDLRFIQTFSVAPGAAGYNMSVLSAINLPSKL